MRDDLNFETRTREIPIWCLFFISPTRFVFEIANSIQIQVWSIVFLALSACLLILDEVFHYRSWPRGVLLGFIWLIPASRIVEIGYAFLADAFGYIAGQPKRRKLTPVQRLQLLGISYVETSLNFALIYLSFPSSSFHLPISSSMQAWYFSWMTVTTTGYGDFTPQTDLARFSCMVEVGIGLMLIVIAVAVYLSAKQNTFPATDSELLSSDAKSENDICPR